MLLCWAHLGSFRAWPTFQIIREGKWHCWHTDFIWDSNRCPSYQATHRSMQWDQEHAFRWTKGTWSPSGAYGSHSCLTKYKHITKHMVQKVQLLTNSIKYNEFLWKKNDLWLTHWALGYVAMNFEIIIFKLIIQNCSLGTRYEIVLK